MPNPSPTPRQHFNSRPSARGDAIGTGELRALQRISIHAPPRGATYFPGDEYVIDLISIHAPPRGATVSPDSEGKLYIFQFTPLREGRRRFENSEVLCVISIHAPPRGATRWSASRGVPHPFQFTPLREGRQQKICNFCKSFVQPLQISMA